MKTDGIDFQKMFFKALNKLMKTEPFYYHVQARFRKVFDDACGTMSVGLQSYKDKGSQIIMMVSEQFVGHLWEEAKNTDEFFSRCGAVINHEIMHVTFGHLLNTDKTKDHHKLANIAADLAVNSYIGRELLPDGLHPDDPFPGILFEINGKPTRVSFPAKLGMMEYFKELRNLPWPKAKQGGGGGGKGQNQSQGDGQSQGQGQGQEEQEGSGSGNGEEIIDQFAPKNHGSWEKGVGNDEASGQTAAERASALERKVRDAISAAVRECREKNQWGSVPAEVRQIAEAMAVKPKREIPWGELLKNWVTNASRSALGHSIKRISKRYGTRPGNKIEDRIKLYVGVDTSGSISPAYLASFFEQMDKILPFVDEITVGECDTQLGREYKFRKHMKPDEVSGGGGTNMEPLFEAASQKGYDAFILFSDLYCDKIKESYKIPVLMVSYGTDQSIYPKGKLIMFHPEDENV